jgi:hypothetical protein
MTQEPDTGTYGTGRFERPVDPGSPRRRLARAIPDSPTERWSVQIADASDAEIDREVGIITGEVTRA